MPDIEKVFGRPSTTVIVGFPLLLPESYGHDDNEDGKVVSTLERSIPRILVSLSFAKSVSEVKRNRQELDKKVEPNTTHFVKFGRNLVYIIGGFDSETQRDDFDKGVEWGERND